MKVSELIKELEEQKNEHGDLDIFIMLISSYPTAPAFKSDSGVNVYYSDTTYAGEVINITGSTSDW